MTKKKLAICLIIIALLTNPFFSIHYIQSDWIVNDFVRIINYLLFLFLITTGIILLVSIRYKKITRWYLMILSQLVIAVLALITLDIMVGFFSKNSDELSYRIDYTNFDFRNDYLLGFKPQENHWIDAVGVYDRDTIFKVRYNTDTFNRRISGLKNGTLAQNYAIFLVALLFTAGDWKTGKLYQPGSKNSQMILKAIIMGLPHMGRSKCSPNWKATR